MCVKWKKSAAYSEIKCDEFCSRTYENNDGLLSSVLNHRLKLRPFMHIGHPKKLLNPPVKKKETKCGKMILCFVQSI